MPPIVPCFLDTHAPGIAVNVLWSLTSAVASKATTGRFLAQSIRRCVAAFSFPECVPEQSHVLRIPSHNGSSRPRIEILCVVYTRLGSLDMRQTDRWPSEPPTRSVEVTSPPNARCFDSDPNRCLRLNARTAFGATASPAARSIAPICHPPVKARTTATATMRLPYIHTSVAPSMASICSRFLSNRSSRASVSIALRPSSEVSPTLRPLLFKGYADA